MKFSFFISTKGGSPLQVGLERGLNALGHEVRYFRNGDTKAFDVLVVFNQTAHVIDYAFPDFPPYEVPVAFVDAAEYGYRCRFPEVVQRYANAFARGSIAHDTKSIHEQLRIRNYLQGKSFPYFLREFHKSIDFPPGYHPIDYPLYKNSECNDKPSRRDYLDRPRDFFISWGASHPWRWPITNALRAYPCKSEIKVLEEVVDGCATPRMDQGQYFTKLVTSKASCSFDGYGSSSFRLTEVLTRTLLLLGPLSIHMRKPLTDGVNCIEYQLTTDGQECYGTNICNKLKECLDDPERAFRIYESGYDWLMTHWTETATARYLVETIERHDWSKPTQIEL